MIKKATTLSLITVMMLTLCGFASSCSLVSYASSTYTLSLTELKAECREWMSVIRFDCRYTSGDGQTRQADLNSGQLEDLELDLNLANEQGYCLLIVPKIYLGGQSFELASWGLVWPWGQEQISESKLLKVSKQAGLVARLLFTLNEAGIDQGDFNRAKLLDTVRNKALNTINCDQESALESIAQRQMTVYKLKTRLLADTLPLELSQGFKDASSASPAQLYQGWNLLLSTGQEQRLRIVDVKQDPASKWQFSYLDLSIRQQPN